MQEVNLEGSQGALGFPGGSVVKNLPANSGATGLIPGPGRSSGEGNGNPLQYSSLENPVDRGAWRAAAHRVAQSQTQLKRLSMRACIGEGMATHCSVLAWRIPGTGKPGGLLSMGLHRVGHD